MKTKAILLLLFAIASSVLAEEPIKFTKLLEYENVEVLKIEPDGIKIRHSGGIRKIPVELIPEGERKQLGLTTEGVDFYRRWKAEEDARQERLTAVTERLQKESFTVEGFVFQIINGKGILLDGAVRKNARLLSKKEPYWIQTRAPALSKDQRPRTQELYRIINEYEDEKIGLIFIYCPTANLVEQMQFTQRIYPINSYTSTTLKGAPQLVQHYTTNLQDAIAKRLRE